MSTPANEPSDGTTRIASPSDGGSKPFVSDSAGVSIDGNMLSTAAYSQQVPSGSTAKLPSLPMRLQERYTLKTMLGQGGFGCVYAAWDDVLQRSVAIKLARKDKFDSSRGQAQFLDEARAAAKLKHPHIVTVYDSGVDADGNPFVVFEFIDGESLAARMARQPLTRDQVITWIAAVAEAIHAAHRAGLVHRDLKPGNILLDRQDRAYVTDFGLAVDEHSQRQQAGTIAGTIAYMSPEQFRGETQYLDGRTDIWSLGVILYELLVHRRPFGGRDSSECRDEILNRQPKPPRQFDDSIPAELERICLKCLGKAATDRYTTAADIARDLRQCVAKPAGRLPGWPLVLAGVGAAAALAIAVNLSNNREETQKTPEVPPIKVGAGESVKPSSQTVENPSKTDPLGWKARLGQEPVELFWPGYRGTGVLEFRPGLQAYEINSDAIRLVKLGQIERPSAKISVSFQQSLWLGGPGLFLGYRDGMFGGRHCAKMQLIRLTDNIQPTGHHLFRIQRTRSLIFPQTGGLIHEKEWAFQDVPAPEAGQSPHLVISFRDGKLQNVQWDGEDLKALVTADEPATEEDFVGDWGLFHQNGSTWFRNPDIQSTKD